MANTSPIGPLTGLSVELVVGGELAAAVAATLLLLLTETSGAVAPSSTAFLATAMSSAPDTAAAAADGSSRSLRLRRLGGPASRAGGADGMGNRTGVSKALNSGSLAAESASIQAWVSVAEANDCPALWGVKLNSGLELKLADAVKTARAAALSRGLSAQDTEALLRQALQGTIVSSGVAPKEAAAAVDLLRATLNGCGGYGAEQAVLTNIAAVIRAQIGIDAPTAVGGPGDAPIANPRLPSPGSLGTATYSVVTIR
jgi:hypothetical protein